MERALTPGFHPIRVNYRHRSGSKKDMVGLYIWGPKDEKFRLLDNSEFYRGVEDVVYDNTIPPLTPIVPITPPVVPPAPPVISITPMKLDTGMEKELINLEIILILLLRV